ncbi:peptidoglycan DD-metalloendopeptidase family protein [Clostridium sp. Marseille-P299]|uniref:peptidoglycan DD-metalloendopeptidase family protein n=1 Tax=Clostridium sp. Marseille-P299 TaxID=1805477 RepID=UPI00082ACFB7|nr:peptidoglycan DD-metalloendopeptidase family protein [Clostridium sp. Marseille-P299]
MYKKHLIRTATILLAALLFNVASKDVKAEETNVERCLTDNSLAGMSLIMNKYYDERLSETGISVSNATTPVYVDGVLIDAVHIPLEFSNLGVSKVSDYVNIRSEASTDSEVVGKLYSNAVATILSNDGEWAKITSGTVDGYIKSEYLSTGEEAVAIANQNFKKYATPTTMTLNIRSGPGTDYSIIAQVPMEEELEIISEGDQWIKVAYGNQSEAYVSKDYVDINYEFNYAVSKEEEEEIARKNSYDINNMIWPLPSDHTIYTYYGYRTPPTAGASTFHKGLDIGGPYGANIVTALSGTVTKTSYNSTSGYYVEVSHGNGVVTRYLHCSKILVSVGQTVMQGDTIALVGSTGVSTGPHLHFSVVINGNNVDPYPYLKAVH